MTIELATTPTKAQDAAFISWWDPASECTVTMAEPAAVPELFAEYHAGAVASYAKYGVSAAIDDDAERCADDTALFWAMTDVDGRIVGGVRTTGPLTSPEDSHAVVEWRDRPGESAVRGMLADRIPSGVIEIKAAWMHAEGARNPHRAKLHARSGFHLTTFFGVDYYMATSAAHTLERWRSTGGVVAPIPATPYPDERYQTKMMWWDRRTFTVHGEPAQVGAIVVEMERIHRRRRAGDHGRSLCGGGARTLSPRVRSVLSSHRSRAGQQRQLREESNHVV
ncbi:hypothetical protein [Mycolicibacterium sp.]|uniref:hypothetical protein n=1 Tax=Mycolicibacterium sp. TaxID=2320850 RepID=UPI001A272369|nr:hypothetical protein [Mycolicibacterium sp.]MBJ7338246.1 hypothetical protein [Mycolicibacterium sp.]